VASEVVRFASLADCVAEPTGIYFDRSGQTLYVNVQHTGGPWAADLTVAIRRTRQRSTPGPDSIARIGTGEGSLAPASFAVSKRGEARAAWSDRSGLLRGRERSPHGDDVVLTCAAPRALGPRGIVPASVCIASFVLAHEFATEESCIDIMDGWHSRRSRRL
jgi:hypothetical protein